MCHHFLKKWTQWEEKKLANIFFVSLLFRPTDNAIWCLSRSFVIKFLADKHCLWWFWAKKDHDFSYSQSFEIGQCKLFVSRLFRPTVFALWCLSMSFVIKFLAWKNCLWWVWAKKVMILAICNLWKLANAIFSFPDYLDLLHLLFSAFRCDLRLSIWHKSIAVDGFEPKKDYAFCYLQFSEIGQ